jgi:signal transduction histidine kinase
MTGCVEALVKITDNGRGISETTMQQLFQPFFTTKGEEGTGLGLWVSRGIVQKHGETLDLVSETAPGRHGTVARVVFQGLSHFALRGDGAPIEEAFQWKMDPAITRVGRLRV